ncbi:MAG: hypothetical protein GY882_01745 [Actinomycetia bacterium]|nr:hypothetical protein [Actinomycetes bacterium]
MALATVFGSLLLLAAVVWVFALVTASKVTIAETAVETKVEQVLAQVSLDIAESRTCHPFGLGLPVLAASGSALELALPAGDGFTHVRWTHDGATDEVVREEKLAAIAPTSGADCIVDWGTVDERSVVATGISAATFALVGPADTTPGSCVLPSEAASCLGGSSALAVEISATAPAAGDAPAVSRSDVVAVEMASSRLSW